MNQKFDKKIFTSKIFFKDIGFISKQLPRITRVLRKKEISKAFIEKIMTVVTAINGCTYCTWFHAKQAASSGISEEEVKNMLNLQFQADASDFEVPALLYAQHYAEANRKPDGEMTAKLFDFYGEKTTENIILFIRVIYFGNLIGNTWDAVVSRLNGNHAEKSSLLFELFFVLLVGWFMGFTMVKMKGENK
jgi:AhpD family alkylhydroperoxidase